MDRRYPRSDNSHCYISNTHCQQLSLLNSRLSKKYHDIPKKQMALGMQAFCPNIICRNVINNVKIMTTSSTLGEEILCSTTQSAIQQ